MWPKKVIDCVKCYWSYIFWEARCGRCGKVDWWFRLKWVNNPPLCKKCLIEENIEILKEFYDKQKRLGYPIKRLKIISAELLRRNNRRIR